MCHVHHVEGLWSKL